MEVVGWISILALLSVLTSQALLFSKGGLCLLKGHSFRQEYYRKCWALTLSSPCHDAIGGSHRDIFAICDRCGKNIKIGVTIDSATSNKKA